MQPRVILYERAGCHLCDDARAQLDALLGADRYVRIDIDTDDELVLRYGFRVPVISVDGIDQLEAPLAARDLAGLIGSLER